MTPGNLVVDASAMVLAVTDRGGAGASARQIIFDHIRHSPHLIDAEIGNALRKLVLRDALPAEGADRARRVAERAIHHRHEMNGPLSAAAWRLRHNLSFYDALHVALAQALDCPLITGDRRLAQAAPTSISVLEL